VRRHAALLEVVAVIVMMVVVMTTVMVMMTMKMMMPGPSSCQCMPLDALRSNCRQYIGSCGY
jgi:hypothetical protein